MCIKSKVSKVFILISDATGSFPDFPDEEDGGSAIIFANKTPEQVNKTFTNRGVDMNKINAAINTF